MHGLDHKCPSVRRAVPRTAAVDGSAWAALESDADEQHIGPGLRDGQADDRVHKVAAHADAQAADQQKPPGDAVGQQRHDGLSAVSTSACSRNLASRTMIPEPTSMPTAPLRTGTVPAESNC